ncbi:hypothetical protein CK203_116156 [Vitis vinifera]|uniref:Uncharacterized protein n=1 Tax=Vitis vinifera TaxID=29760 RepID=A0A438CYY3_VITVI|nr:hypothetical protein CK203_116156 [Vitis vinifera]
MIMAEKLHQLVGFLVETRKPGSKGCGEGCCGKIVCNSSETATVGQPKYSSGGEEDLEKLGQFWAKSWGLRGNLGLEHWNPRSGCWAEEEEKRKFGGGGGLCCILMVGMSTGAEEKSQRRSCDKAVRLGVRVPHAEQRVAEERVSVRLETLNSSDEGAGEQGRVGLGEGKPRSKPDNPDLGLNRWKAREGPISPAAQAPNNDLRRRAPVEVLISSNGNPPETKPLLRGSEDMRKQQGVARLSETDRALKRNHEVWNGVLFLGKRALGLLISILFFLIGLRGGGGEFYDRSGDWTRKYGLIRQCG